MTNFKIKRFISNRNILLISLLSICLFLFFLQLISFSQISLKKFYLSVTPNKSPFSLYNNLILKESIFGSIVERMTNRSNSCGLISHWIRKGLSNYINVFGDEELRQQATPLFREKKLVIWTSDHHSAPVLDLRSILEPLGVEFIDHTLFHSCDRFCHCDARNGLRVLNEKNVLELSPGLIGDFQRSYPIGDPEISKADAFATFHCFGHFELFLPYNKSLIAISTIRFETCRAPRRWDELNFHLAQIHNKTAHVVGANNRYDQEYIKYFTGLNVEYIPSFCLYTGAFYKPTRKSYLFYAQRNGLSGEFAILWNTVFQSYYSKINASFVLRELRQVYSKFDYTDLASHLGIVHIPYQISTMSIFEQYRMAIPLFFPSVDLFTRWNVKYRLAYDRTSAMLWGFSYASDIPPHASQRLTPDPNAENSTESQRHWLPLADFYTLPHITYFSSIEELVATLQNMTRNRLLDISFRMQNFNRNQLKQVLRFWRNRLVNIAKYSVNRPF